MDIMNNCERAYITGNEKEGYNLSFSDIELNKQYKTWAMHHEYLLGIIEQVSWQRFNYFLFDTSDKA